MLIAYDHVQRLLEEHGVKVTGALHVGAHDCEEMPFYVQLGLSPYDVVWIDAIPQKVEQARMRGIPNVHQAVITDQDNVQVLFHVTNNIQSSSVLPFGTHAFHHPHVVMIGDIPLTSSTLDTFFTSNRLVPSKYTFWNMDIQGAELMALRGAQNALQHVQALYLEVNREEVYQGCGQLHDLDTFLVGFTRVETRITEFGWGDALYVRRKQ